MPSYAAVEPTTTNLNIDAVVLACEQAENSRVLQLQLYLLDDGRLRPSGAPSAELRDDPRAVISIDRREFPVAMLFAGAHVLLADRLEGAFPRLSDRLVEAMQVGRQMVLRFDLLVPQSGRRAPFDGEATVDLHAAGGREAVAAMRRCAGRTGEALRSIRGEGPSPCRVRPKGRQHLSPNCCRGSVQQGDRHRDFQVEHLRIGQRPALSPVPH